MYGFMQSEEDASITKTILVQSSVGFSREIIIRKPFRSAGLTQIIANLPSGSMF